MSLTSGERTDAALNAEKAVEDVKIKMRTMAADASVEEKRQFDITADITVTFTL